MRKVERRQEISFSCILLTHKKARVLSDSAFLSPSWDIVIEDNVSKKKLVTI